MGGVTGMAFPLHELGFRRTQDDGGTDATSERAQCLSSSSICSGPRTTNEGEVEVRESRTSRTTLWTPGLVTWEVRRGFSRALSGSVSTWLECA